MAVVTGGVTSRVGDIPGDSGTTWPRSSRGGEPERGYQSPPQSSSKPPDSAEKCEWLSAAMRRAGRLAMRRMGGRTHRQLQLSYLVLNRIVGWVMRGEHTGK